RRGAILLRTFSTAVRTPLPPYRFFSPSRSSCASCSPVLAPEGTAARPTLPEATVTSHSSVGLPRLSRISLACTSTISVMARPVPRPLPPGNAHPGPRCAAPDVVLEAPPLSGSKGGGTHGSARRQGRDHHRLGRRHRPRARAPVRPRGRSGGGQR